MTESKCILCNKEFSTGLNIMGCFICFPCEQKLLQPNAAWRLRRKKRLRLAKWLAVAPENEFSC
jgi:Inhibitor of sigma-G Gin.